VVYILNSNSGDRYRRLDRTSYLIDYKPVGL